MSAYDDDDDMPPPPPSLQRDYNLDPERIIHDTIPVEIGDIQENQVYFFYPNFGNLPGKVKVVSTNFDGNGGIRVKYLEDFQDYPDGKYDTIVKNDYLNKKLYKVNTGGKKSRRRNRRNKKKTIKSKRKYRKTNRRHRNHYR